MKRFLVLLIVLGFMLGGTALAPTLSDHKKDTVQPTVVTKIGYIGDSITAGAHGTQNAVQSEMDTLGSGYEAVNRGMNGATTTDWLPNGTYFESSLEVFKSEKVKVVSIMLGVNDAVRLKMNPEQYVDNMRAITSVLLQDTDIRFVIINYPTYVQRDSDSRPQIAKDLEGYRERLDTIVNGTTIVKGDTDAYAYFRDNPNQLVDGVHPTDAGYKKLGELWARALSPVLTTHDI